MRRQRVARCCEECGGTFATKPSVALRFCSRACYYAFTARAKRTAARAKGCRIEDCSRRHLARGLCSMHYQRVKHGAEGPAEAIARSGSGNANWKGGRVRGGTNGRYWMRHTPSHPAANSLGYVLEHRLVVEARLGRLLTATEVVHHINRDPSDNRIENLRVMTQAEHVRLHMLDLKERPC